MRTVLVILVVAATALAQPKQPAAIHVNYDAEHLDLDKRTLQFKLSRAADKAQLIVIGEDGAELDKSSLALAGQPANKWIAMTWTKPEKVMVLRLRVESQDGSATNVELIPWSVEVAHEDVNFATDSAVIEPSEAAKLDASLAKITEIVKRAEKYMKPKLYVAGHTDTVGPNAKNRKLSLDRALAIGAYFRKKGLKLPIDIAGFGEEVLKVKTPQDTDERLNRRADYVIGPVGGAPPFQGPYLKVRASWQPLR